MRTKVISGTTVEYPDEISFSFNPVVINISGYAGAWIEMLITDVQSGISHSEKRELFGTNCFFDASYYMQSAFDTIDFNKIDYSVLGAQDSKVGRFFSVEINFYNKSENLDNSFQFDVFIIWGAMKVGERYNGDRWLTWFRNYPFSVGMYSNAGGKVKVEADELILEDIDISERKVWNIMLKGIEAKNQVVFKLPGDENGASVFDNTFDLTFKGLKNLPTFVHCKVDDSDEGVYLRWINRHGFYCYWLFINGDESRQITNDGEFIRNNMMDYNYINGYHGGTGRKQRKMENSVLSVCASLVNSEVYDFLFQLALSPVVDMYCGCGDNGVPKWITVNVSVGTFAKSRNDLQDFIATIILPETRIQSL